MKKVFIILVGTILVIIACKTSITNSKDLNLVFESKSESTIIGTANFTEKNGVVVFTAKMSGLSPGIHAIHIHEKSDCGSADGSSAGGHWNPTFEKHGKWGDSDYHKGDIGNFTADGNGNGTVKFSTSEWCIGCEDETKNIVGKSIIVHKGVDDFTSQPAGNAGARQACSAIIK